jgi:hypothetical protein
MRRFRRLIRVAITASLVLALWAIARPASAATASMAPFCDDRGATAVASPPVLPMLDQAFFRAGPTTRADAEFAVDGSTAASIGPSRSAVENRSFEVPPFVITHSQDAAHPAPDAILAVPAVVSASPCGVHIRVERPPRRTHTRAANLSLP